MIDKKGIIVEKRDRIDVIVLGNLINFIKLRKKEKKKKQDKKLIKCQNEIVKLRLYNRCAFTFMLALFNYTYCVVFT